jgi:DNA replication and repair protein RecF
LHLDRLILTHFKNYESQRLIFSERINCFVGLNGMGKTNILDAVYYLCMCKSYFLPSDGDVILRGQIFMRLEGHFKKNNQSEKIVAKVQNRKKKIIERNDNMYAALSNHIGFLPVVMFAPDDTLLAKEGSEERRRFMDTALSQIDNQYLTNLIFYNKILDQRNALLKKSDESKENTEGLLAVYDTQMTPPAQYIFDKRQAFISQFTPVFNDIYKKISGAREDVTIHYNSQLIGDSLTNLLKKSREKDRLLQRTTTGIHKDDWLFEIDEKPLKKFGSQGQLKSFVMSLKLAQYEVLSNSQHDETKGIKGEKQDLPILLLDDIFDKLDDERVSNLLQLIVNQSFGQIFITDTHEERINDIVKKLNTDFKVFKVNKGIIE